MGLKDRQVGHVTDEAIQGTSRNGSVLERISPKQGFQNTSNVSATLVEW